MVASTPRHPAAPHRLAAAAAAAAASSAAGAGSGAGGLGPTEPATPLGEARDTAPSPPPTPLSRGHTTPGRWSTAGGGTGGRAKGPGLAPPRTACAAAAALAEVSSAKAPLLPAGGGSAVSTSSAFTTSALPSLSIPRRASTALWGAASLMAARARSALEVWRDAGERDGMVAHGGAGAAAAAYAAAAAPPPLHGAPASAAAGREVLERLGRMGRFEGQDFDPTECDVERVAALHRGAADYAREDAWRWVLTCEL